MRGLVLAAALAAVMSTSSGALIACATVANNDIWSRLRGAVGRGGDGAGDEPHDEVKGNRAFILIMGIAVILIAIALNDVVEALTVAYNLLVGRAARADHRRAAVAARHGGGALSAVCVVSRWSG